MVYFGSKWHKKIIELKSMYRDCSKVYGLNVDFFNKFDCQKVLKVTYIRVAGEIDLIKFIIDVALEELEQEENIKLKNYVKGLLNGIEGEFNKLQNDIKEMINNVG